MIITEFEQGTQEWLDCRLGVITASRVHDVIKKGRSKGGYSAQRETYMMQLVAEVCTGEAPKISGKPLEWGNENEPHACDAYEARNFEFVEHTGLIYKDDSKRCGASPDGLIGDDGGIEIKCPYTTPVHLDTIINGTIKPEYVTQMQFVMWVTGRDWIDFCSYDPRMKGDTESRLHVIRIDKCSDTMETFDTEIPKFIEEMDQILSKLGFEFGDQWK